MLETRSRRTPSSSCLLLSRYLCNFFSIQFMDISLFMLLLRNFSSSLNRNTYLFFSLNVLLNERKITGNASKKKSSIVNVEKWAYFTYLIWKYFGYICRNPLRVHRNGIDYHSLDPRQNNLQNERERKVTTTNERAQLRWKQITIGINLCHSTGAIYYRTRLPILFWLCLCLLLSPHSLAINEWEKLKHESKH